MYSKSFVCAYLYTISKYGYPPPAENTATYLREMKDLDFVSVELEGIREAHLLQMCEQRFDIKQQADELGLSIPIYCIVLPGLASADGGEREKNIRLFEKGCETAAALGARGVLDNAPLPPYQFPADIPIVRHYDEDVLLSARFPANLDWQKYWRHLVDTYRTLCDIAVDKNLTYHLHPCLGVLAATTDAFLYFYDAVGKENLRFNLDTANQFVMKDNLALSLRRLADHIDYIHLSDNRGIKVEHLAAGDGAIHWQTFFETLKAINYQGLIGLDIGGEESGVKDIDDAYQRTAIWLEEMLPREYEKQGTSE